MIMRQMYRDMVDPALTRKQRRVAGFYLFVCFVLSLFVIYCFLHALMLNISIYGVVLGAVVPIIVIILMGLLVKRFVR